MRFRRVRVDAKRNCKNILADTNESGYVWTGPEECRNSNSNSKLVQPLAVAPIVVKVVFTLAQTFPAQAERRVKCSREHFCFKKCQI